MSGLAGSATRSRTRSRPAPAAEARAVVLGHVQRGGTPTRFRPLAGDPLRYSRHRRSGRGTSGNGALRGTRHDQGAAQRGHHESSSLSARRSTTRHGSFSGDRPHRLDHRPESMCDRCRAIVPPRVDRQGARGCGSTRQVQACADESNLETRLNSSRSVLATTILRMDDEPVLQKPFTDRQITQIRLAHTALADWIAEDTEPEIVLLDRLARFSSATEAAVGLATFARLTAALAAGMSHRTEHSVLAEVLDLVNAAQRRDRGSQD